MKKKSSWRESKGNMEMDTEKGMLQLIKSKNQEELKIK